MKDDLQSQGDLPADATTIADKETEIESGRRIQVYSKKKSWWRRFLAGEPPDPRSSDREVVPGLVAHFFTGGPPAGHQVRNISPSGFYVHTEERWYPDTILRVTLSDEREPSREYSITVPARVVRQDEDGVGLQFVLSDERELNRRSAEEQSEQITKEQVESFVERFKGRPLQGDLG